MKWQINAVGRFYHPGEAMVVYYDSASGDTHLVNEFAAYLIQQFADQHQPMDIDSLIEHITHDIDPADLLELTQSTPAILAELVTLDILQRV
jgi:PqqD family protein of HPr-rel-A system